MLHRQLLSSKQMEYTQVEGKIEDLINCLNEDESYILAAQITQLLTLIEVNFGINLDAKIHEVSNLFINQYYDVAIRKVLLLDFINGLVELDIISLVNEMINEKSSSNIEKDDKKYPLVTSSPLPKENNDTISLQEKQLKDLDDHINSRISSLGNSFNESPKPYRPENKNTSTCLIFFTILFNRVYSLLITPNQLALVLNLMLVSLLSITITFQNFEVPFNIYNLIYKIFIYPTSKDLYWWQKIPYTEQKIWFFLDYIKFKDQNFTMDTKRTLIT